MVDELWLDECNKPTFAAHDGSNQTALGTALQYISDFSSMRANGICLYIFGGMGVGKTFLAWCITRELVFRGQSAKVTTAWNALNYFVWHNWNDEKTEEMKTCDLLVLDDFRAGSISCEPLCAVKTLKDVLEYRNRVKLPVIITTDERPEILYSPPFGLSELYGLIKHFIPVELTGENKRRQAALKRRSELEKLLFGDESNGGEDNA